MALIFYGYDWCHCCQPIQGEVNQNELWLWIEKGGRQSYKQNRTVAENFSTRVRSGWEEKCIQIQISANEPFGSILRESSGRNAFWRYSLHFYIAIYITNSIEFNQLSITSRMIYIRNIEP